MSPFPFFTSYQKCLQNLMDLNVAVGGPVADNQFIACFKGTQYATYCKINQAVTLFFRR